jgi:hypothetical protein
VIRSRTYSVAVRSPAGAANLEGFARKQRQFGEPLVSCRTAQFRTSAEASARYLMDVDVAKDIKPQRAEPCRRNPRPSCLPHSRSRCRRHPLLHWTPRVTIIGTPRRITKFHTTGAYPIDLNLNMCRASHSPRHKSARSRTQRAMRSTPEACLRRFFAWLRTLAEVTVSSARIHRLGRPGRRR